jgi:hypothetical protein
VNSTDRRTHKVEHIYIIVATRSPAQLTNWIYLYWVALAMFLAQLRLCRARVRGTRAKEKKKKTVPRCPQSWSTELCMTMDRTRVNKTARERFPRISKNRAVYRWNRAVYRYREFIGTVFGWEPDRFMYRAGPVPQGTGRTGPVPTGFANPGQDSRKEEASASCVTRTDWNWSMLL